MSKKKAIDTMKKHKMDTSFIKEAKGNVVVIDRKYIPKIAHVRKVLKLKMGKDLSVYKTDSKNVYHKVSDSQIKRFLDRLDRFDVKYKLGESVNEGPTSNDLMKELEKVNKITIKILKKYEKSIGNYMPAVIQKWMMSLHSDIKKQGYRV